MYLPKTYLILATCLLLPLTLKAAEPLSPETFSSVEERRIENSITQERANLRKDREEISLRKKELKTLEEGVDKKLVQMDKKLQELKEIQKKIESLLAEKSESEKKKRENLAAIYAKMTPARAALALSGLEQQLAADLLANMKVKSAAKILDQITKQKASALSTTFSTLQIE